MEFEWDPQKARANLGKHGISFREATTIFYDPFALTGDDPDHSDNEQRFITFGLAHNGQLLVVSHVERENRIRIISARLATRSERKIYEEG